MPGSQRTLERIKELDHLHRNRVRSAWQSGAALAGSLRFLRAAARQLTRPTQAVRPLRVPHPAAGCGTRAGRMARVGRESCRAAARRKRSEPASAAPDCQALCTRLRCR